MFLHIYHVFTAFISQFQQNIFYDIDKKYICDIMDTRGDKNGKDDPYGYHCSCT